MKKTLLLFLVLLGTGWAVKAQQEPQFTMFMFNKQMINPAYAGSREVLSFTGLYRNQWVNMEGAPVTYNFGAHSPMSKSPRVSLGGLVYADKISVFDQYGIYGQYAYRFPVSSSSTLSLGLQAGVENFSARFSDLDPRDPFAGDVVINQDIRGAWLPNFGMGAYLSSDNYYVGFSVPRIIQNRYNRDASPGNVNLARQFRHYFLMAGLIVPLSNVVIMKPNFQGKYVTNPGMNIETPLSMDYNMSFIFLDRFLLGISYRTNVVRNNDSFNAIFEMQITPNLRMGYAYDYTLSELQSYNSGSHEVMIGYDIAKRIKAYTSPRFIKYF